MLKSFIAVLVVAFFSSGCENGEETIAETPSFPKIEQIPILVIHHKKNGDLIHYLALRKVPENLQILVEPANEEQELFVTVLGKKRNELLKRSLSISSQVGEAYLGRVTVIVENGLAVSIDGNGFHSPALISEESMRVIEDALANGKTASEGPSTIRIPKEQVE